MNDFLHLKMNLTIMRSKAKGKKYAAVFEKNGQKIKTI
jgi:hypothetical protein